MGLFDVFKNKTKKSQKTSYSMGNKYITEYKKTKTGTSTKIRPVKSSTRKKK